MAHGLKSSKERANDDEVGERRASSMQGQNRSPDHDANAQELANGYTLDRPVDGVFNDQDGDVDASGEPREQLRANQVEILLETHDRCERHGALVEGLEEVGEDHDCEYAFVDQFLQSFVLRLADVDLFSSRVLGDFGVHTAIVLVVL